MHPDKPVFFGQRTKLLNIAIAMMRANSAYINYPRGL